MLLLPALLLAFRQGLQKKNDSLPVAEMADSSRALSEQINQLSQRINDLESQIGELRQTRATTDTVVSIPSEVIAAPLKELTSSALITERAKELTVSSASESVVVANPTQPPENGPSLQNAIASWMKWLTPAVPKAGTVTISPEVASPEQVAFERPNEILPSNIDVDRREVKTVSLPNPMARKTGESATGDQSKVAVRTPTSESPKSSSKTKAPSTTPNGELRSAGKSKSDGNPLADAIAGLDDELNCTERYFDIRVMRPEPGNIVSRYEDMIATTKEFGWPVVLVRSEIEGDSWWVQQIVTRQGNMIAARVNFGNNDTISGHGFEVVVLLLDSSAEAVRFRTAREFKEIPPGVRRSRLFQYVRG